MKNLTLFLNSKIKFSDVKKAVCVSLFTSPNLPKMVIAFCVDQTTFFLSKNNFTINKIKITCLKKPRLNLRLLLLFMYIFFETENRLLQVCRISLIFSCTWLWKIFCKIKKSFFNFELPQTGLANNIACRSVPSMEPILDNVFKS